jgi:hypothetical protein
MEAVLRLDGLDRSGIFLQDPLQYVLLPDEKLIEFFPFLAENSGKPRGEKFVELFLVILVQDLHGSQVVSGQEVDIATEKLQIAIDIVKRCSCQILVDSISLKTSVAVSSGRRNSLL